MFKELKDVTTPDERHRYFVTPGTHQPMTLAHHHRDAAAITLAPGARPEVTEVFDRARNAFVYSWFDYDLGGAAELLAFGAMEQALKRHYGIGDDKRSPGLQNLYGRAVADGLFPPDPPSPAMSTAELVAHVRNEWAHGKAWVHDPGSVMTVLRMCASRINELTKSGNSAVAPPTTGA
jgi:hypothetical protein